MDRSMDSLDGAPGFSYRRLVVTLLIAAAIIVIGSLVVRSFPNSGHQAGYDAVMKRARTGCMPKSARQTGRRCRCATACTASRSGHRVRRTTNTSRSSRAAAKPSTVCSAAMWHW